MERAKKNDFRHYADIARVYGAAALPSELFSAEQIAHTLWGLWLNLDRMLFQPAISVALGLKAAVGGGQLDRVWFDALARHESQIDELAYSVNAARADAEMMKRRGRLQ
jgi:hypothetical protein